MGGIVTPHWFTGNLIGVDEATYMTNRDIMIMSMTFSYEFDTIDIGKTMRGTGLKRHQQLEPLMSPKELPGKLPEDFAPLQYDRPRVLGKQAPDKQGGGGIGRPPSCRGWRSLLLPRSPRGEARGIVVL